MRTKKQNRTQHYKFTFMMNDEEKSIFEENLKSLKIKVKRLYLVKMMTKKFMYVNLWLETIMNIKKNGNNLNQLMKFAHTRMIDEELQKIVVDEIIKIRICNEEILKAIVSKTENDNS